MKLTVKFFKFIIDNQESLHNELLSESFVTNEKKVAHQIRLASAFRKLSGCDLKKNWLNKSTRCKQVRSYANPENLLGESYYQRPFIFDKKGALKNYKYVCGIMFTRAIGLNQVAIILFQANQYLFKSLSMKFQR